MTAVAEDWSLREHPRTIGWFGTTALAMGGSNQSLFLIPALVVSQGSAAVPLLVVGLLLSWAAAPGWLELVLMWPNRVGGIAATCAEAFRPYSAVLANLTGVCYWWGWIPTCGLTAILSGSAIHQWVLPQVPVSVLAVTIVVFFTAVNLAGVRWVTRLASPIAVGSAVLAFLSVVGPVVTGSVDWRQAATFHLVSPFAGVFGEITSAMAGLYLIGFAAPAFEAATCHVGETKDPVRNVRRAMIASGAMAGVYFLFVPVVWLGVIGTDGLSADLAVSLGPVYGTILGAAAKSGAIMFMIFNMFHGTLQPLAGAARTLSQLSEDGLLPRVLSHRSRTDTPWVATTLTAALAIAFLLAGDPVWMIAAANFTYLIGIGLPSVAVWLLRRHAPELPRPWRAPRGTVMLGVGAAAVWGLSTVLGFEQYGLPTVLFGLALAYSGAIFYTWRVIRDRRDAGLPIYFRSMHLKLTGAMLAVMVLDGAGYLLAVQTVDRGQLMLTTVLQDIFVAVAILTVTVGLVLPGTIAQAAGQLAASADRLAQGTLADLTKAMEALAGGRLDDAHAQVDETPVTVHTRDEIGVMAENFNVMQSQIAKAAIALDVAREELRNYRDHLEDLVAQRTMALEAANQEIEQRAGELTEQRQQLAQTLHDLETVERERRQLLAQTIRGREDERTWLAAELHDGPIQRLTAVRYGFEEASLALEYDDVADSKALLAESQQRLEQEIRGLRSLMTELRPPALNEQGLEPALRDLAGSFSRRTGLDCPVAVSTARRMSPEAETVLYRVVQEALTNIANHARAHRARVELTDAPGGDGVELTIVDDGVGFALEDMPSFVSGGHFGLAGMRERAELTAGRYTIDSTPGHGTRVQIWMPATEREVATS
ncbi:amino acid permease [Actinoplanes sp. HUAS TT8]|uniref:amino acid permease n=1 Tax=Actinoplanes sp. HUAS TT8 TaxID=3447453 RepID=UPI003F527A6E